MFRIESIQHQAFIQNKQQLQSNDMSTYSTSDVFFCGIPHHNYHYNNTVTVNGPLLRLIIIENSIRNIT
jgi:hypothetical protein